MRYNAKVKTFDGKKEAKILEQKITSKIEQLISSGNEIPKLGVILVGESPDSIKYVSLKENFCKRLGIPVEVLRINPNLSDNDIIDQTEEFINRPDIKSVIIQMPLPRNSLERILKILPPEKDVDCLSTIRENCKFESPVIRATKHFLKCLTPHESVKKVLIIGHGDLVGRPLENFFKQQGITVTYDENYYSGKRLEANLVILSTGIGNLVDGQDIGPASNVIDFGFDYVGGKLVGDLDMHTSTEHLGVVSTSPGGMGPLVVRYLVMNHLRL